MAFNKVNQMKRIWVIQEYYKERNKEGPGHKSYLFDFEFQLL